MCPLFEVVPGASWPCDDAAVSAMQGEAVSADPVVVARVAERLNRLGVDMVAAGHRSLGEYLVEQALLLAGPPATGCKGCGGDVPDVPNGRPRLYCHACRAPRTSQRRAKGDDPAKVVV